MQRVINTESSPCIVSLGVSTAVGDVNVPPDEVDPDRAAESPPHQRRASDINNCPFHLLFLPPLPSLLPMVIRPPRPIRRRRLHSRCHSSPRHQAAMESSQSCHTRQSPADDVFLIPSFLPHHSVSSPSASPTTMTTTTMMKTKMKTKTATDRTLPKWTMVISSPTRQYLPPR